MSVKGVNHVNIIAEDLDGTCRFYGDLLGFKRGESPGTAMGYKGAWLLDDTDQPIVHLMAYNDKYHAGRDFGSKTGSIDHVAFTCDDFAGTIKRCEELGVDHRINNREFGGLRQIFVTDPNNVALELNFDGD